jgi:hypothetical protein
LSFSVSERALQSKFALQLGCNIVQSMILQILGEHIGIGDEFRLPFLLTSSPIDNTSEDVLCYWADSPEEAEGKIRANVAKISSFLKMIKDIQSLSAVEFFITEGYDISYRAEQISLDRLADRFVELAREYDWMGFPSVVLTVPLSG